jgi:hypothetical protein
MRQRASQQGLGDQNVVGLAAWRQRRLQRAGFDEQLAEKLAGDRRFDLHAVLELVDRGCRPELAARILAPLEDSPDAPFADVPERVS